MKSLIPKSLFPFIENSILLSQMFVILLFFENYSLYIYEESIFDLKIEFDLIKLKPFFAFIYFLAITKGIWWVLNTVKIFSSSFYNDDEAVKIKRKQSFTLFLLLIVTSFYLFKIMNNPSLFPFYIEDSYFTNKIIQAPIFITAFLSLIIFLVSFSSFSEKEN
ncbi:hypothetical protein [uncultured Lacinutrix sp.]|uniref:hypothetical protein n=1 Tax=uncultured Lacinutrix sp. TaxID=574032 RepID=UPI002639B935|nr:hypothetical protein [uncultured Lacinutrix sp.]